MKIIKEMQMRKFQKALSWVLYLLYMCLFIYFSLHHCRWFDEAQAWLIARESNLITLLPAIRCEGHPFLWYLYLMLPAHYLPFQSITFFTAILVAVSFYYIIFRSPFSFIIRISLPLTYYIFYQYGIIARSYVLFVTLSIFAAVSFKKRFENKCFFSSILLLLSLSFHSFLMGVGLTAAYMVELAVMCWKKTIQRGKIYGYGLQVVILILMAIFIALHTYPPSDQYFINKIPKNIVDFHRIYMILTESTFSVNKFWLNTFFEHDPNWFKSRDLISFLLTIGFYSLLIYFSKKTKTILYFVFPFIFVVSGLLFFYASSYHVGLIVPLILFAAWIILENKEAFLKSNIFLRVSLFLIVLLMIGVQIHWTVTSICYEDKYPYSGLPELAEYIKKNNINDISVEGVNCLGLNAYFSKNIFRNVTSKPYFIWCEDGNITRDNGSPRYILKNHSIVTDKEYYRVLNFFKGSIHNKGFSVSHDDSFILYELKKH